MTEFNTVTFTLVGLMSDTHDNLPLIDKAVKKLNQMDVELVLHAGDYVAGFVVPRLKEVKSRLIGVFGNNDGDRELLKRRFGEYPNLELRGNFAEIVGKGYKIALLHGSDEELMESLIAGGNYDFVVHGHTHNAETYRKAKTLVVNPGEVCGYLTGRATIALLDTSKRQARIVEL
jgi:putative phosphoesterase